MPANCSASVSWYARMAGSIGRSKRSIPRLSAICRASPCVSSEECGEGITAHATRSAPSASTAMQAVESGVDAAREPEQHALEAVLLDVVAQPERQGRVDLLVRLHRLGARAADLGRSSGVRERRARRAAWGGAGRRAPGRWRVSRRRTCCSGRGVDVADDQLLLELRAARHQLAVLVDHEAVAVEHQLVLAADEIAEDDVGEVVAGPLDEHPLALAALVDVVGRSGDVDDHLCARERLVARPAVRAPRCPRRP